MKDFIGKVAVVTGGASGIGRALAERCAREGMKVVLADIEQAPLEKFAAELKEGGTEVLAVCIDVSKAEEIEKLAKQTVDTFGGVHLVFNNAGVGGPNGYIWENTLADWEWVMGVNVWSVINGIRVFVPIMLAQDTEAYMVNTASLAGLISYPGSSIYQVSKHAVVSMTEALYYELKLKKAKVGVSVLCPAWVKTKIFESDRNRPVELQNDASTVVGSSETDAILDTFRQAVQRGKSPEWIADQVFEAIQAEQFYIVTHSRSKEQIETRMQDVLLQRNPSNQIM